MEMRSPSNAEEEQEEGEEEKPSSRCGLVALLVLAAVALVGGLCAYFLGGASAPQPSSIHAGTPSIGGDPNCPQMAGMVMECLNGSMPHY